MSLKKYQNIKSFKDAREQGFTIVELLIVIIVIAILAALVISAYTGIQSKAQANTNKSNAKSLASAAQSYMAENDPAAYPVITALATGNQVNFSPPSGTTGATATANSAGGSGVGYRVCTTKGAMVTWWNNELPTPAAVNMPIGVTTTCP